MKFGPAQKTWRPINVNFLGYAMVAVSLIFFAALTFPFIAGALPSKTQVLPQIPKVDFVSAYEVKTANENKKDNTFKILIPKIDLVSDIIYNVDVASDEIYNQKLKAGIAHANGSYFPGEKGGPVFLFAHSTSSIANIIAYNAKFFNLKDLKVGDGIKINFRGKIYQYIVTDEKVVEATDVESVRKTSADLILMTCWPLGTDWKRLMVFADLIPM